MSASHSAVISTIGRGFDGLDVSALAQDLGAEFIRLEDFDATVAAVLAEAPAAENIVAQGTGDIAFDAEVAAALGLPLAIISGAPQRTGELAQQNAESLGATVAGIFTDLEAVPGALASLGDVTPVMSADLFQKQLIDQARAAGSHIVLPEGDDDRILEAAHVLLRDKVAKLTILGNEADIKARAEELKLDLAGAEIINHLESPLAEEFAADFAELRKKKGVTLEQARETMQDISYFATMMVHKGLADGMVSGAAHTTAHTIKPSFQIIKTKPNASVVSSIFLMVMRGRLWAFGDCAVNPNPTAEQLGEIAIVSAQTASQFGIDPRVAMLSYSSGTSGSGPDVERAVAAVEAAKKLDSSVKVDGPLQFDAACDPGVAAKKMPNSEVAGQANVFVFPDLEAGNIGYKTAQRTGGALAVGPILQGLNKPVNDLSRGATVPDIINTVAITAIQAGEK
ncbi:phosphate acetyltransferase [Corynebacterium kefirresidentii]|uniref:phosphate acetyltransferase n=1 Tax=Corynebacterium TaxID=1716 RepID=UPI0003B8906C|nr:MULTISPECIES: phosphate acetyltransferase [Corynebacterium]WKS53082.1 phosphate acetyltransferase [Corynebacterium tuberculostearicum]ERS50985.1 phosphate acetyltransferase [Corynebacterium sp. KPL1860]ERS51558.1 phosphate acetyltransferase [Corynebacterium sp. KPL1856]ERS56133.1 phosphate acetyltransferase [Corynebacterium sp. KPL1821]ERS59071.1 phosphate acetyltransferase [Corynebacterium sp. KPL1817]